MKRDWITFIKTLRKESSLTEPSFFFPAKFDMDKGIWQTSLCGTVAHGVLDLDFLAQKIYFNHGEFFYPIDFTHNLIVELGKEFPFLLEQIPPELKPCVPFPEKPVNWYWLMETVWDRDEFPNRLDCAIQLAHLYHRYI